MMGESPEGSPADGATRNPTQGRYASLNGAPGRVRDFQDAQAKRRLLSVRVPRCVAPGHDHLVQNRAQAVGKRSGAQFRCRAREAVVAKPLPERLVLIETDTILCHLVPIRSGEIVGSVDP